MNVEELYNRLETDFIKTGLSDDWELDGLSEYVCDEFKERAMGLVCDHSQKIKKNLFSSFSY